MLQVSQCRHLTSRASISMTSMPSRWMLVLPRWQLQVASVEGRLSISSRTSVTSSTARALRSTWAVIRLFFLIDPSPSPSPSRRITGRRSVRRRGCSPLSTLSRTTRVFLFRRTLARSGHAAVQRLPKASVLKDQACGRASSEHIHHHHTTTKDPKEGTEEEMIRPTDAFACSPNTPHSTHPCIFPSHNPPRA